MTEHLADDGRELILAREAPFSLAGTQVRPAALEVEHDGSTVALEPRVMKVLVALHRSRGLPVSRDELIDLCWGGRIVTEGALNRCTAQLRKALAPNPRIRIDTIPTVGYRLQASADVHPLPAGAAAPFPAAASEAGGATPKTLRVPGRWLAAGAVAVAALVVGGALWAAMPRPVQWTASGFHPLTSELGLETHPALSVDGSQIVYGQRDNLATQRDLWLRGTGPAATPVRITSNPLDDYAPAWSPKGDRIAFVRGGATMPCMLVVVPVPLGPERIVGRCQAATYTRVSWLNENTLVISDRPVHAAIRRVRAVDIASGQTRDLTAPPPETLGDGDPVVSPDGRYIVFRRSLMHGADDLFLKDVKTGRERALTTDGWKAPGYVWSADSRHVFFSSNRGGAFGLWTVDTRIGGEPKRIGLGFGQVTFSRMSADGRNRLAVEVPSGRTNLARLAPSGTMTPITNANGADWDPQIAADGTVVYISDRSGASEVWLTHPDGRSVQLTSLVGSYVNAPVWSADERSIAFVSVKGRRSEIWTVDRDGSRLRALTSDGADKLSPVFAASGDRLLYVLRDAAGYRVMQVALTPGATPTPVPGLVGWREIRKGPGGRLYGVRDDGLIRVVRGGEGTPIPRVVLGLDDSWTVGAAGIHVLRGRTETAPPTLWLHPWTGGARPLAELPYSWGELSVAADGSVILSRDIDDQIDLGLVELSS